MTTLPPTLWTVLREWVRIGCIGFGGPPTHIKLFRELCVEKHEWFSPIEFEDAIAACNLLPGPASTQLAIYCAWRVRGRRSALLGGVGFIMPGLILILALATLFLTGNPPQWVIGAGAGASAAVGAIALDAGISLAPASWARRRNRGRWIIYLTAGAIAAAPRGTLVVVVLIACGLIELAAHPSPATDMTIRRSILGVPTLARGAFDVGVYVDLARVALKVGALSYGGGFVIIPLMYHDAVNHYHWMSNAQFLNAVALGQVTPGPVVQTIAAVGYSAAGLGGGLIAALIAFTPSFAFVLLGARHFYRIRTNEHAQAFLAGSGPAAIGAIIGSAIPLIAALTEPWQFATLVASAIALLALHRGTVATLLTAASLGTLVAIVGGPLPH